MSGNKRGVNCWAEYIVGQAAIKELRHDIVVRMPPLKRYSVSLEIKSVRQGEPRIVEPGSLEERAMTEAEALQMIQREEG